MEKLSIYILTGIVLIVFETISKKYEKLQNWLDENPKYFNHYLWLTIPTIMSTATPIECWARNTEKPISAYIFYLLMIFFWENIISSIDKWAPEKLEVILKIGLAPIMLQMVFLQGLGLIQKRYYKPYFKEKRI